MVTDGPAGLSSEYKMATLCVGCSFLWDATLEAVRVRREPKGSIYGFELWAVAVAMEGCYKA